MRGLREHFADYAGAINRFDAEGLAHFFHSPCLMVNGDSVVLLPDDAAVRANMVALLRYHGSAGFERAEIVDLREESLGGRLALVHVRWYVRLREGADWDFRNSYNLVSRRGDWKVVVSTTHEDGA